MKRFLLYSICFLLAQNFSAQTQLGTTMNGAVTGDLFGAFVSISSNGNRYVVGSSDNTISSAFGGYARVYDYNGSAWNVLGADIAEEVNGDNAGAVAISGDGSRIIIGGYLNDGNGTDSGHVRVYQWNGSAWTQVGADINGEAAGDNSGVSVSISSNGSVIAVGAHNNDGNGANSGHVRVYAWNGSAWVQRGVDLNGEAASDNFGVALSMSQDGTKLAVGARYNDAGGSNAGHVRVFNWNGSSWVQMGADIDGFQVDMAFGSAVSISNTGTRVAIGTPLYNGTIGDQGIARVYNYNGSSWSQIGQDIIGWSGTSGTNLGKSISISGDGNAIVVGSSGYSGGGSTFRGLAEYYKLVSNVWTQQGADVLGNTNGDRFGFGVSLSNDGNKIAVGAPYNASRGYAEVFDYTALLSSNEFQLNNKFSVYPNPISNQFQLNTDISIDKVEVLNLQGQVIKTFESQESYNINDLSAGIYLVMIHSEEGKGIKKIIKN